MIVVSPNDTGIRSARAKTGRLDSRTLAKLLAAGELNSVWVGLAHRLARHPLAGADPLAARGTRADFEQAQLRAAATIATWWPRRALIR